MVTVRQKNQSRERIKVGKSSASILIARCSTPEPRAGAVTIAHGLTLTGRQRLKTAQKNDTGTC